MRNGLTIVFRLAMILLLVLIALDLRAARTELHGIRSEQVKNTLTKLRAIHPDNRALDDPRRQAVLATECTVEVTGPVDVNMLPEPIDVRIVR
jgi:hypothetical protein